MAEESSSSRRHRRTPRRRRGGELVVSRDGTVEHVAYRSRGQIAIDAATSPLNLGALVVFLAGAFLLGYSAAVAVIIYAAMVAVSFIDKYNRRVAPGSYAVREALMGLPPSMRTRVQNVLSLADGVRDDLDQLSVEPAGVRDGLDQMTATLIDTANRVVEMDEYLMQTPVEAVRVRLEVATAKAVDNPAMQPAVDAIAEQLGVLEGLYSRRQALDAQIERIAASLGAIHARVIQVRVESDEPLEVVDELQGLRDSTRALAEGFEEVGRIDGDRGEEHLEMVEQALEDAPDGGGRPAGG